VWRPYGHLFVSYGTFFVKHRVDFNLKSGQRIKREIGKLQFSFGLYRAFCCWVKGRHGTDGQTECNASCGVVIEGGLQSFLIRKTLHIIFEHTVNYIQNKETARLSCYRRCRGHVVELRLLKFIFLVFINYFQVILTFRVTTCWSYIVYRSTSWNMENQNKDLGSRNNWKQCSIVTYNLL